MTCNKRAGPLAGPDYAAFQKFRYAAGIAALVWVTIVALCFSVQAQAVDSTAFDQGLLWRVEKAGAPPSYVFGTIHLADPRVNVLPPPVKQRFDAAQAFAMEVQLDQASMMLLAARMIFTDGRNLPGVAGDALFRQVVPELEKIGLPAELARMFKPWAVMMMLEVPPQQSEEVLDLVLQRAAEAQGKSMHYLESIEEQIGALDGMSDADQVALLRHTVASQSDRAQTTQRMLEAYLRRDLAQMWRIGEEDVVAQPALKPLQDVFVRRLLIERNLKMVERMRTVLAPGNVFVAIGALHLYGEQGVLNLLQDAGYRVSRIY